MIMMRALLIVVVLVSCLSTKVAQRKRMRNLLGFSRKMQSERAVEGVYETKYFNQKVSHFNYFYSGKTYKQKYLIDASKWKEGGAILMYCGNEGPIEMFYKNSGYYNDDVAVALQGLVVYPEHRYFGESMPFGDQKTSFKKENLILLTTEEAMMDMVEFVRFLKATYCEDCPVIAFGGSYGGMLASWMRMKYPNVIDMAHAASAPIYYYANRKGLDLGVFYQIVTKNYAMHSSNCVSVIRESYKRLQDFSRRPSAPIANLSRLFNLCTPLKSYLDISLLVDFIDDAYSYLAMLNYPYPTAFLKNLTAWPANSSCIPLDSVTAATDNEILFGAIRKSIEYYYGTENCHEIYGGGSASDQDMSGWDVLACGDQAMPMTSDGIHDMFYPTSFDYAAYSAQCRSDFGIAPDYNYTLNHFGGVTDKEYLSASKIIFTNGGLDPWSGASPKTNLSSTLLTCLIPNGAHHLDLRTPNQRDPADVIACRNFVLTTLKSWIASRTNQENIQI